MMVGWLIYGKRTGLPDKHGQPVFDKTFRALNSKGQRVTSLNEAMCYATKEDAQLILDYPGTQKFIDQKLVVFEIRRAK